VKKTDEKYLNFPMPPAISGGADQTLFLCVGRIGIAIGLIGGLGDSIASILKENIMRIRKFFR